MPVPQYPDKHDERALVTTEQSVAYHYDDPPTVPERVLLCFSDSAFEHIAETYETTAFETFARGLALDDADGQTGVVRVPGVGAPATSLALEELLALGTETVVVVGYAGAIDPTLGVGDFVVVDRALRDDGTSHHYREPAAYASATPAVVEQLAARLDETGESYRTGPTWTTDAPHRETASEVEHYRDEGILTVDMEAAAAFAIARRRSIDAGALFTVSDRLDPPDWEPMFADAGPHLERALESAIAALR